MASLADKAILSGAENRPPMLEKDMYDSWRKEGVTRLKKYSELSAAEAIQIDCNVKATNIILQALPPEIYALVSTHKVAKDLWERIQMLMQGTSLTKQERECKLYDAFDKFTYQKGETLRDFYLRFSLLLNEMNMYNMKLEQFQVNIKFLNTLPPEWSKFVTDVKLRNSLNGDVKDRNVKQNVKAIETLNIELDHKVTKLAAENEHLKQTYKQLYDSIKSSRVRSKEQCDDLINKFNLKSAEVSDLNARLQEKVLVITALKVQLDKLKGKVILTEAISLNPVDPKLLKVDVTPLVLKLRKNKTAHTDYIRHTQEEAATLRKIDQLCSSCELSKAKRSSFKSKVVPSSKGRLNLLHMDLCGPMRVASINRKKYILVIIDDYSRYTWTLFLRSKDETPKVLKEFLTMIQRNLQAPVITASDYDNSDPVPQLHNVSSSADAHVPSQQELDLLFGPLYDEFFNAGSNPQDKQPTTNIQPTSAPSTPTYAHAKENNDDQAEEDHLPDDEFTNPFCYRHKKLLNHPLEQVRENPSRPVQTRRQHVTDLEMCMFALTVSTTEPKTIKEAMANSAWIETMQEELH
uniref:Integrase, catalytic region, zinc finger, CCHC-type, peptidase aspartic, catalytic n=1 Tax=Tanacetum cinerariifolium TaxID=118510 RepID=A0A6L2LE65_TANCI|nr:integrase, catalytic region, zinc finger, CCHC-type, peptidase aspartic, catalytic [Tanacetum cinerariifolium]